MIINLDQMVLHLEWVTLWNNSEVEDYRHPRPEPLSIKISNHPIEVDQYSAFATYNGLPMNF